MVDLKIIWHNQFTADSFCKPQIIKVEFCENLIVQETCAVTATQLKELHLIHLPKLKHIWKKDPQEIFSFKIHLKYMLWDMRAWKSGSKAPFQTFLHFEDVSFDYNGIREIVLRNPNCEYFREF